MKAEIKLLVAAVPLLLSGVAAAESWSHGRVDIIESYKNHVMIRWDGPNTEKCGKSNVVAFSEQSLGDEKAMSRAYSTMLTAAEKGFPVRFHLKGCESYKQKAVAVQLCTTRRCEYQ